ACMLCALLLQLSSARVTGLNSQTESQFKSSTYCNLNSTIGGYGKTIPQHNKQHPQVQGLQQSASLKQNQGYNYCGGDQPLKQHAAAKSRGSDGGQLTPTEIKS
ncbi:unnamed protein product, partial [marine sediment metagenome]